MINTIYCYTNLINGKKYVGQTWKTIEQRAQHNGKNYKGCPKFWRAIKKYGWDNFKVEVVCLAVEQNDADFWEKHFITIFDTIKNGYNCKVSGNNGFHSEETKKKIGAKSKGNQYAKGNKMSEENINKLSIRSKQQKHTNERKMVSSKRMLGNKLNLGHKNSEETKQKRKESLKKYWDNNEDKRIAQSKKMIGNKFGKKIK
jgi:group I intron endonuclease